MSEMKQMTSYFHRYRSIKCERWCKKVIALPSVFCHQLSQEFQSQQ